MKNPRLLAAASLLSLAMLSACNRADPPSDQIERAAEEMVGEIEGDAPAIPPAGRWAPRDECAGMAGAAQFRTDLRAAVEARDTDALVALAASNVKLDFGEGSGAEQMRERLSVNDGALWQELDAILDLGCAADGETTMTMPWYFAQEMPVDPMMGFVVTGMDVPLRDGPEADAAVLARISWDVVEQVAGQGASSDFVEVRWRDIESGEAVLGFIARDHLRSIIDYRLIASRRNERWRITMLVAGD